ncbi:endonuclease/exonuclease/phosphatase family protein [Thermodesulfobacteriota bacterium]
MKYKKFLPYLIIAAFVILIVSYKLAAKIHSTISEIKTENRVTPENGSSSFSEDSFNFLNDDNLINIASFNIQIFGKTKASKPEVMDILVKTIVQYDLVAIQEIKDKSGTAIKQLENMLDRTGINYDYVIGPRLGRSSSKEQYAFIYNTNTIQCIETSGTIKTYPDPDDIFAREPTFAKFQSNQGNFDFVLINIHTKPSDATNEINNLTHVIQYARAIYQDEGDFIVLGDYNADGDYFDETAYSCPLRSSAYQWLITNDMDTNVAGSERTYDRIVITQKVSEDYTGQSGVFRFDSYCGLTEVKKVSDHYPVWASFYTNRDTD